MVAEVSVLFLLAVVFSFWRFIPVQRFAGKITSEITYSHINPTQPN